MNKSYIDIKKQKLLKMTKTHNKMTKIDNLKIKTDSTYKYKL